MTPEEIKYEDRKQRRLATLGTQDPRCMCGQTHWACFEEHHIAKRGNDPKTTALVCVSCHRILTAHQNVQLAAPPGSEAWRVRLRECLLGIAHILRHIADILIKTADELLVAFTSGGEA